MAFRKIKAKKYAGIVEYYNPQSRDKETKAFYANYRDEFSKPKKTKLSSTEKEDALIEFNALIAEVTSKRNLFKEDADAFKRAVATKDLTLAQASKEYFKQREAKCNEEDLRKMNNRVIYVGKKGQGVQDEKDRVLTPLGKKKLSKVTTDDIKTLQKKLSEVYGPKTTNEQISSLSSLFNHAVKKKWTRENPVDMSEIKKLEENTEPGRVLSRDEMNRMFDVFKNGDFDIGIKAHPTLYFFSKLLYLTGARPAAILDVQMQHCKLDQGKLHLKAMKKGKSYQQALTAEAQELIREWIEKYDLGHGDFLFYAKRSGNKKSPVAYSVLRRPAQKIFDKVFNIGIPTSDIKNRVSLYSLRRTSGTRIYEASGIMHAMVFLNHTSIKTTQMYLNVDGDIGEVVNVL